MRNSKNLTFLLKKTFLITSLPVFLLISGCDYIGISNATDLEAKLEQEGAAAGAGCRLEGLSLISCYDKYPKMRRAHILKGWRDMNSYMIENKMTEMPRNEATGPAAEGAPTDAAPHTNTAPAPSGPVGQTGSKLPI